MFQTCSSCIFSDFKVGTELNHIILATRAKGRAAIVVIVNVIVSAELNGIILAGHMPVIGPWAIVIVSFSFSFLFHEIIEICIELIVSAELNRITLAAHIPVRPSAVQLLSAWACPV